MSEESVSSAEGREVPGEVTQSDVQAERASQHGWVSEEEWIEQGKDPDEWVDAKTFNMRGEFFDKIHKQKREIDDMRKALDDLKTLQQKTAEIEREKVLRELKAAKKAAVEAGDGDAVVELDDRIDEVKAYVVPDATREQLERAQREAQDRFVQWKAENDWYDTDPELAEYADFIGMKMQQEGKTPDEIFETVGKKVKQQFKHKFDNPRRSEAAVASTTGRKSSSRGPKIKWSDLPEDYQKAGNNFVKTGVYESREEYIKTLAESGVI